MRIVRYDHEGETHVGERVDSTIYEIDLDDSDHRPPAIVAAEDGQRTGRTLSIEEVNLLPPVGRPGKLVCLGLNYVDHAEEGGYDVPDQPLLFSKATSAVIGQDDPISYPPETQELDYEAELAIVIGKQGRRIDAADAEEYVAGYTAMNDVSARDVQYDFSQFFRGKSFDTFAPLGPALVPAADLDPSDLAIGTYVNNERKQDSSTSRMIFDAPTVVESVSETMTLYPGDVIATGTPPGVGVHRDPPELLEPGDEVVVEIEGIGRLRNVVEAK